MIKCEKCKSNNIKVKVFGNKSVNVKKIFTCINCEYVKELKYNIYKTYNNKLDD